MASNTSAVIERNRQRPVRTITTESVWGYQRPMALLGLFVTCFLHIVLTSGFLLDDLDILKTSLVNAETLIATHTENGTFSHPT